MTFYELYQYYKNRGKETGEGIESITDTTQYIPIPPREGGGGNDFQGGGKFGNLNLDDTKTFNKEVWEVGGPANQYGSWVDTDVTGYLNPKTGQYQTFEGKNINHLGIEVPTIAGMIFDKNFGKGPQPGDIKGTFTDGFPTGWKNTMKGWKDSISNIGNPFKNTIHDPDLKEDENWENVTYDASKNITTNTTPPNLHGGHDPNVHGPTDYGKGSDGQQSYDSGQGFGINATTGGPVSNKTGRGRQDYVQGGRIGFFGGGDYKEYWKMVTDMYIQAGSEEGTGMSLTAFADKYFKKREGGIMTIPTQLHG